MSKTKDEFIQDLRNENFIIRRDLDVITRVHQSKNAEMARNIRKLKECHDFLRDMCKLWREAYEGYEAPIEDNKDDAK